MGSARALPTTDQTVRLRTKSSRPQTFSIPVCASSRGDPPVQSLCHSPFPPPNPAKPAALSSSYRRRKVRIVAITSLAGVVGCLFFGQVCLDGPFRVHQPSTLNPQPSCSLSAHPLPIFSAFDAPPSLFLRQILPGKIDVSPFWTMCLVGKRRGIAGLGKDASGRTEQQLPIPEAPNLPDRDVCRLRPWWPMTEPPGGADKNRIMKKLSKMGSARDLPAVVRHSCRALNRALCRALPRPSSSCSAFVVWLSTLDRLRPFRLNPTQSD